MAKISARGATKVSEFWDNIPNDIPSTGGVTRYIHVLRSDGKILRASSFPNHPAGSYDRRRSSYRIVASVSPSCDDPQRAARNYHHRFIRAVSK